MKHLQLGMSGWGVVVGGGVRVMVIQGVIPGRD